RNGDGVGSDGVGKPPPCLGARRLLRGRVVALLLIERRQTRLERPRRHGANQPLDRGNDVLAVDLWRLIGPVEHRADCEVVPTDGDERMDELLRIKPAIVRIYDLSAERKEQAERLGVLSVSAQSRGFDD